MTPDLGQRSLSNNLKVVLVVENGDFFLQELFHWVAERYSASEIFIIKESHLAIDRSTSTLCKSSDQLCGNFVASRRKQNSLEIECQAEICNNPLFQVKAQIGRKRGSQRFYKL